MLDCFRHLPGLDLEVRELNSLYSGMGRVKGLYGYELSLRDENTLFGSPDAAMKDLILRLEQVVIEGKRELGL